MRGSTTLIGGYNLKPGSCLMAKRHSIPRRESEQNFTRNARPHPKNYLGAPLRGGIRL